MSFTFDHPVPSLRSKKTKLYLDFYEAFAPKLDGDLFGCFHNSDKESITKQSVFVFQRR